MPEQVHALLKAFFNSCGRSFKQNGTQLLATPCGRVFCVFPPLSQRVVKRRVILSVSSIEDRLDGLRRPQRTNQLFVAWFAGCESVNLLQIKIAFAVGLQ